TTSPPPLPTSRRATAQIASAINVSPIDPNFTAGVVREKGTGVHPWRRYFARMIDMYLFAVPFFFFIGMLFPELFSPGSSTSRQTEYLYSLMAIAAYVIFETICLNVFGNTLGKVLYGIRIKTDEDRGIAFSVALKRSLAVWFRGLGCGIPIFALVTTIVAYRTLKRDGQTSWDRDFKCTVFHDELSVFRWIVIGVAWLALLG